MKTFMTAGVLALALSGMAHAATLVTPPLVAEGENVLDCYLANVGSKTRQVLIQAVDAKGGVVQELPTTLEPGEEKVVRTTSGELARYCRFVTAGPRADFRGSVLAHQFGVGAISALAAQ